MAVETGDKVTRKYKNFRGVDFRGEECSLNRSPDSLNVWRNYKNLASIETRPALEHMYTYPKGVSAMKWHKGKLYFLSNDGYLHAICEDGTLDTEILYVGDHAILFEFGGELYAKGTNRYCNVTKGRDVEPYVPTTTFGRKPTNQDAGGGTTHQDVNMLSDYRINSFLGDGESMLFWLDAQDIDKDFLPIVTVDGVEREDVGMTSCEVDYKNGRIEFTTPPPAPETDGQDNITVKFKKTVKGNRDKIINCTIMHEFDNRVFLSGNPDYPSTVWHSSLNDPSYFSDLDRYDDGADQAPIRSMVAGNNGLWVFRDAVTNSVFYHQPAFDDDYGKIYPSSHSSIAIPCTGKAVNFNDDIVFFGQRGMEGASTDVTTEQFATHRSSLIDRKMLVHPKYKDMVLSEWEGYLLVFMGSEVYLADSRAVLTNENHMEYEWYHWNFGKHNVSCALVNDGVLYIGTSEGHIYSLTRKAKDGDEHLADTFTPIESYWTTPKDTFGATNKLKTTNKKGCIVEALGDVAVYVKTDNAEDFELIGTNAGIDDYFVSRIKRKKWKDIQLKFESKTSFSLEAATLEAFIGGFIKR